MDARARPAEFRLTPEPPPIDLASLLLCSLPALLAAAYAVASAALGHLSPARRLALRDTLLGRDRRALERYVSAPSRVEGRWLMLRVAGIAATAGLLVTELDLPGSWAIALASAVALYAIPSELGRQFASTRAEAAAPFLLRWLRPGEWLVAPLADPLNWLAMRLTQDNRSRPAAAGLTETEVELIVSEGELSGALDHEQSEMIRNVLDFGEVTAEEVMVPRIHVDALDAALPISAVLQEVQRTRHSRYPVYADSIDNIVGILHVKDLLTHVEPNELRPPTDLRDLARKPVAFVPEGQLASTVLRDMRAGRHHMAVVIDEFGGFSGVVTLEDLLEEIVGDIQDEHDGEDQERIRMVGEGRALVDASLPVTDVNRQLGTNLPEGDYISLGGLLLDRLGAVPAPGSQHDLLGLSVLIRDADERHVALVELTGLPSSPGDGGDGANGRATAAA
jgi:CBS domain containing-hemolysin-like protein